MMHQANYDFKKIHTYSYSQFETIHSHRHELQQQVHDVRERSTTVRVRENKHSQTRQILFTMPNRLQIQNNVC